MNENKLTWMIVIFTIFITLFNIHNQNWDILLTKLQNVSILMVFGTLFGYFYLNKYTDADEKISKNSTALANYLGFIWIAIAIVVSSSL